MPIDINEFSSLREQLLTESQDKDMISVYAIASRKKEVVDDPEYDPFDGVFIEGSDGYCTFPISSIESFNDIVTAFGEIAEKEGMTKEELSSEMSKPFEEVKDLDDFLTSLPDYVMKSYRFIPYTIEESYVPGAVFLTKQAAEDFVGSRKDVFVEKISMSKKDVPHLRLLSDLIREIEPKSLKKVFAEATIAQR